MVEAERPPFGSGLCGVLLGPICGATLIADYVDMGECSVRPHADWVIVLPAR